jgi:hypothetical protein
MGARRQSGSGESGLIVYARQTEKPMSEYRVVSPLGKRVGQHRGHIRGVRTLDGLTIGELSNHKFDPEFTFEVIEKALLKRYPTIRFVSHTEFGDTYGSRETEVIESLPEKLARFGCDAVVSGNAG